MGCELYLNLLFFFNYYFLKKTSRAQGLLPKRDTLKLILKKRKHLLKTH